jgi:hypothetical protein
VCRVCARGWCGRRSSWAAAAWDGGTLPLLRCYLATGWRRGDMAFWQQPAGGLPSSAAKAFLDFLHSDDTAPLHAIGSDASNNLPSSTRALFSAVARHVDAQQSSSGARTTFGGGDDGRRHDCGHRDDDAGGVYTVAADAFTTFMRGGGNVQLYKQCSTALAQGYTAAAIASGAKPWSMIDIGAGSGMALLPALHQTPEAERPHRLDIVEPSPAMLSVALTTLQTLLPATQVAAYSSVRAHVLTLQEFMEADLGGATTTRWELAQATFSLQSIRPPQTRVRCLRWLAQRVDRLLMVEFDVPPCIARAVPSTGDTGNPSEESTRSQLWCVQRISEILSRYERGIAEYIDIREGSHAKHSDEGQRVVDGFLIPVLLGCFRVDINHATNDEQPISVWEHELREAGFETVRSRFLCEYWWADAYIVEASTARRTPATDFGAAKM